MHLDQASGVQTLYDAAGGDAVQCYRIGKSRVVSTLGVRNDCQRGVLRWRQCKFRDLVGKNAFANLLQSSHEVAGLGIKRQASIAILIPTERHAAEIVACMHELPKIN